MSKETKLLPDLQITAHEWDMIAALLEGHTYVRRGQESSKDIVFQDGYAIVNTYYHKGRFFSDTGWEYPESETVVDIKDLDINPSDIRMFTENILSPKSTYIPHPTYTIKDHVSDSILELTSLFTKSALNY